MAALPASMTDFNSPSAIRSVRALSVLKQKYRSSVCIMMSVMPQAVW